MSNSFGKSHLCRWAPAENRTNFLNFYSARFVKAPMGSFLADFSEHPTVVVVQTPFIEWLRWLDALAEFVKGRD
jgi:hypothetical protein